MVLTRLQGLRFFKLFDPLTVYGNACLDIVDEEELLDGSVRGISEEAQAKVAYELWQELGVVDRFVAENPAGLSAGELDIVRTWRDGLSGQFVAWRFPDGKIRFIWDGYAFEVCGISKEIESMIGEPPVVIHTTLLPFEGRIVYSEYLGITPVQFGEGIMKVFSEMADEIEASELIVRTADDFLAVTPEIRERIFRQEADELARDLESGFDDLIDLSDLSGRPDRSGLSGQPGPASSDEPGEAVPEIGQHRGVLAGMTDEERQRAISEQFDRESPWSPLETLQERCTEGPVVTDLRELLSRENLPGSDDIASAIEQFTQEYLGFNTAAGSNSGPNPEPAADAPNPAPNPNPEPAAAAPGDEAMRFMSELLDQTRGQTSVDLLADYVTQPESLEKLIIEKGARQAESLRALMEAGGQLRYPESSITTLADKPATARAICYLFHDGTDYVYVMPDEVLEVARGLDWQRIADATTRKVKLVDYFDQLAELRGIVRYTEAIEAYAQAVPDGYTEAQAIHDALTDAMYDDESSVYLLDTDDEVYLLHYELMWEWCRDQGRDWRNADPMEEGPLGDLLKGLLAQQQGKEPRNPTPEMLQAESLFAWKEAQGCCRAMRDYLDAHVPDVRNDYYFADKVLEELIEETKWGLTKDSAQFLFDTLEENDFVMASMDDANKLLGLWMNMGNALPSWPNNGNSPNDLLSVDLGRPAFFNEDGSMMKVGRNDPCPCGSGKKYKKCCGR